MNYRKKIVSENLAFCKKHIAKLNDWERGFIQSLNENWDLSQNQFNKLSDITLSLKDKIWDDL